MRIIHELMRFTILHERCWIASDWRTWRYMRCRARVDKGRAGFTMDWDINPMTSRSLDWLVVSKSGPCKAQHLQHHMAPIDNKRTGV